MNILVCISNVPDTTSKINFKDQNEAFDTNGVQFIINPNDEFGLTRAIWLQQKSGAKVTVVTIGDSSCEPILRKCLAIGADQAIRIDTVPTDVAVAELIMSISFIDRGRTGSDPPSPPATIFSNNSSSNSKVSHIGGNSPSFAIT